MKMAMVNGTVGLFGALITYSFGGWTELLRLFLLTMAIDYITGILAALKERKGLNSTVGFWGLAKKALMLLIIMLGHQLDVLMGMGTTIMSGCIYFYLANEMISITENYGRIGLPLPLRIKNMIDILKDKKES